MTTQWNKEKYFMMKRKTENEDQFCDFIKLLEMNLDQG